MAAPSTAPYRFGDLLALARRSWVLQMAEELAARGYGDYRITDAACTRVLLRRGAVPVGVLAGVLGVTRQAARKAARGLEERGFAQTRSDEEDRRRVIVALTPDGLRYGEAVVEVIALLNRRLSDSVDADALRAADSVLRAAIADPRLTRQAARIGPPGDP